MSVSYISKGRDRSRRRRPPTLRMVWAACWCLTIINMTVWLGLQVARGAWWYLFLAPAYPILYAFWRRTFREARQAERDGRSMRAPDRDDWLVLATAVFVQLVLWMTLVTTL